MKHDTVFSGQGIFSNNEFKGKLEIWCYNQMRKSHNYGLKLKDPIKRQYNSGIANGFARTLDKLIKTREKKELKAAPKNTAPNKRLCDVARQGNVGWPLYAMPRQDKE